MKRLGIYDMGKDIDRNITRQLWEKETGDVFTKNDVIPVENGGTGVNNLELFTQKLNVFTKNDVIPVENGGTGVNDLNLLYPKLVSDEKIKEFKIKDIPLEQGFTLQDDSTAVFTINKKSMFIEGLIHVKRNTNSNTKTYLKVEIPNMGYNIKNIQFFYYGSKFSIINNILSFEGYFDPINNNYQVRLQNFIPFI